MSSSEEEKNNFGGSAKDITVLRLCVCSFSISFAAFPTKQPLYHIMQWAHTHSTSSALNTQR